MQRLGGVSRWASVLGLIVGLGCEDTTRTITGFALPDGGDASVDGGDASLPGTNESPGSSAGSASATSASLGPSSAAGSLTVTGRDASAAIDTGSQVTAAGTTTFRDAGENPTTTTLEDDSTWNTASTTQPPHSTVLERDAEVQTSPSGGDAGIDASEEDPTTSDEPSTDGTSFAQSQTDVDTGLDAATGEPSSSSGCGDIPVVGTCVGALLQTCVDGEVLVTDCASIGRDCKFFSDSGPGAECVLELDVDASENDGNASDANESSDRDGSVLISTTSATSSLTQTNTSLSEARDAGTPIVTANDASVVADASPPVGDAGTTTLRDASEDAASIAIEDASGVTLPDAATGIETPPSTDAATDDASEAIPTTSAESSADETSTVQTEAAVDAGSDAATSESSSSGGCGDVPVVGTCVGDVLQTCVDGEVVVSDCAMRGQSCRFAADPEQGAACVEELDASVEPDSGPEEPDLSGCSEVDLSNASWSVLYVDSTEPTNPPEYAIDGQLGSYWHTEWSQARPGPPHEFVLDIGEERALLGFTYIARQDTNTNGTIADFELYLSLDSETWLDPVDSGTLANTKSAQSRRFDATTARYVRLVILSAQDNDPVASMAEFKLLAAQCPGADAGAATTDVTSDVTTDVTSDITSDVTSDVSSETTSDVTSDVTSAPYQPGVVGPYLNGVFPSVDPQVGGGPLPQLLSETGAFSQLQPLTPSPALMPYEVNQPLWSDGAAKSRWIALANDGTFDQPSEQVRFDSIEPWKFPAGTVLVKHFEMPASDVNPGPTIRLETRFLVFPGSGFAYGLTYRWNDAGTDAELLTTSETRTLQIETSGGQRSQTWTFPGRVDCDHCHTTAAGYALGFNQWQLNRAFDYPNASPDNQLTRLRSLGVFNNPYPEGTEASFAHAVSINDGSASVESRLKSYMAANCGHCHRPGGIVSGLDARFQTPLSDMISEPTQIPGSQKDTIVEPGLPFESELFLRDNSVGAYGMPPIAKARIDDTYINLLGQWIESLSPGG